MLLLSLSVVAQVAWIFARGGGLGGLVVVWARGALRTGVVRASNC